MRSYGQYCAVAKALDVIGDRWNLLIIRELMLRGGCRYTDLLDGLPGIATNLLAERLRNLEQAGVAYREEAPPPVATTLFRLTPRGEALRPIMLDLLRWGAELMAEPAEGDAFRTHWLAAPVQLFLEDQEPARPTTTIELRAQGEQPLTVRAAGGEITTRPGSTDDPDLVLAGTPHLILGTLTGRVELADAQARGLSCDGDTEALRRMIPSAAGSSSAPALSS